MPDLDFDEMLSPYDREGLQVLLKDVAHPGMIAVEVGTWKGLSAQCIAEAVKAQRGRLYCVDPYEAFDIEHPGGFKTDIFLTFQRNMVALELWDCVCPMLMTSLEASAVFADGVASLVFIDADHHHEEVRHDVKAWLPKVRQGGILCGHDWNVHEGVTAAVKELLPGYGICARVWYYRKAVVKA